MMSACSDFLDREPLTTPNSETFLSNASAVNNYINGLYIALPSFGTYDMGVRGEEKNSDNIVAEVYDKRLNGELQENGGGSTEWQKGYQNLRRELSWKRRFPRTGFEQGSRTDRCSNCLSG